MSQADSDDRTGHDRNTSRSSEYLGMSAGAHPMTMSAALDDLPMRSTHYALIILLCAGYFFDTIELVMTSVFGTIFSGDATSGRIETWQLSLLLSSASIGATLGSPLLGSLADRFGRRRMLALSLIIVGVFSTAGALSRNINELIILRAISALGIGCFIPLSTSYLAELIPARARGRAISIKMLAAGIGGILGGILTAWFGTFEPFGLEGWRCTMLVAALGSLLIAVVMLRMPESPTWLFARGFRKEAEAVYRRLAGLSADAPIPHFEEPGATINASDAGLSSQANLWTPERKRLLIALLLIFSLSPWAAVTFPTLVGAFLAAREFSTHDALLMQSAVVAGVSVGAALNMLIVDRVSRLHLLVGIAAVAVVGTILFGVSAEPIAVMATGMMVVASLSLFPTVLLLYAAEQFPPLLRARVPAICYGAYRALAIIVPMVMLPVFVAYEEGTVLVVVVGAMAVCMVALILLGWFQVRNPRDAEI